MMKKIEYYIAICCSDCRFGKFRLLVNVIDIKCNVNVAACIETKCFEVLERDLHSGVDLINIHSHNADA